MKLARLSDGNAPFWAVVDTDAQTALPLSGAFRDWAAQALEGSDIRALADRRGIRRLSDLRWLPPIERGSQVIVVGANYLSHLKGDFKIQAPKEPVAFLKSYRALIGAGDAITHSPLTAMLDYEIELVVVIGAAVDPAQPMRSVLGYTIGNDVSARDLQKGSVSIGMDLFSAKSLDGTTPLGPWIVTRDEFGDSPPDLRLTLAVNGETRQDGRTSEMRWNVAELINFVNARVAFEAGDVMFTGTPAGVGQSDGRFLQVGDLVEASIEKLGTQRNVVARRSY